MTGRNDTHPAAVYLPAWLHWPLLLVWDTQDFTFKDRGRRRFEGRSHPVLCAVRKTAAGVAAKQTLDSTDEEVLDCNTLQPACEWSW